MKILGFQVTEKTTSLASQSKYVFWIGLKVSKQQVKQEVEEKFKVDVIKVNIINLKGKKKTWRQKKGRKKDRKKAIVTIKKGQRIKEFETAE